ncbi:MlaA family lipoprotein [Thioclava sp. FR2]|uniref:MlaA family lipoprotein n=1 Tax=Thioclava sp. FR2 TaxID=3445780 RepID=UPI003EBEE91C
MTAVVLVVTVAACAQRPAPAGIQDPREAQNREIHEFNKAVDRTLLKPFSGGGNSLPTPLRDGVSNAARNLDAPGNVVNNLLQGRPHHAVENTFRFFVNSTIGIAGLFDPATEFGIVGKETDFGETLHVWGAGEGNYVELPFLGPSTERDMVGMAVDTALNPWRFVLPRKELNATAAIGLAGSVLDRGRYSETVDSILYDSADSYAQARLIYLQNRRFKLGQTAGETADDAFEDPYEDPYGN